MPPKSKVTDFFVMENDFCKFFGKMMEKTSYQITTNVHTIHIMCVCATMLTPNALISRWNPAVKISSIANTLRSQLNWSQYRRLIQIDDPDKREYYVIGIRKQRLDSTRDRATNQFYAL